MGSYLQKPVTTKTIQCYENKKFRCCIASMQGWRLQMEDSHIIQMDMDEDIHLFAVFDGHGGNTISAFLKENFVMQLKNNENYAHGDYFQALEQTFIDLDQRIKTGEVKNTFVGSTAIVALIVDKTLYVANLGDSRCLLQRDDEVMELSKDHVPHEEIARIKNAGGFIDEFGRLQGTLSVSRTFGDFEFKSSEGLEWYEQRVICMPEIRRLKLSKDDEFLFLGCDGMFETFNNYKVMEYINNGLQKKEDMPLILEQLLNNSLASDTKTGYGCDNMTAMIIQFIK